MGNCSAVVHKYWIMNQTLHAWLGLWVVSCLWAGCSPEAKNDLPEDSSWEEILAAAEGQTATMMMWQGDPLINAYMQDFIRPKLQERYGVDLRIVDGQGSRIVQTLLAEAEAGVRRSDLDLVWINGETFYQLRQIKALYGPFTDRLPHAEFIDWESPFIGVDFQQPVEGYECPWGNVQMALIYDSLDLAGQVLPQSLDDWAAWWAAHPGRFTIGSDFTGMTLLKAWLAELAGGRGALNGPFDEALYEQTSDSLWAFINAHKQHFWNEGSSFPANVAQMHQLFANGELAFTMSNNDAEVDNKIRQGVFTETARAYVPAFGTIRNSHYLGVVERGPSRAAALVAINFLISPEAQWKKMHPAVWGDHTVLDRSRLPVEWRARFQQVPGRQYAPDRDALGDRISETRSSAREKVLRSLVAAVCCGALAALAAGLGLQPGLQFWTGRSVVGGLQHGGLGSPLCRGCP
jgi:putative spermidine/putrescine transport system substrate-binding protein